MASVYKRGGKRAKGTWQAAWRDHTGKRRTKSTRTTDKAAAERIAAKLEADAALRKEGVIDAGAEALRTAVEMPVERQLADFQLKLEAANRTAEHVRRTIGFIRDAIDACNAETSDQITETSMSAYVVELRARGLSARAIAARLRAVKSWTKWLVGGKRLAADPLTGMQCPNPQTDRRHQRRMLLPEEWVWLSSVTAESGERFGMTGRARALLYDLALQTGLRAGELRSLKKSDFELDCESPWVRCGADSTKNRRAARQYFGPRLASELGDYLFGRPSAGNAFELPHATSMARMLRNDVEAARSEWLEQGPRGRDCGGVAEEDYLSTKNSAGEVLDFHALRHTCGAWLARSGASAKAVQTVMRHSSITLTMDTYGHLFPGEDRESVGAAGKWLSGRMDREAQRIQQRAGVRGVQRAAGRCEATPRVGERPTKPNTAENRGKETSWQPNPAETRSSPGGTRTPDQGIMSPLL